MCQAGRKNNFSPVASRGYRNLFLWPLTGSEMVQSTYVAPTAAAEAAEGQLILGVAARDSLPIDKTNDPQKSQLIMDHV